MGGEPLFNPNLPLVKDIIYKVKNSIPDIKIYVWTGYTYEELLEARKSNYYLRYILENTDILIDSPYIEEERDITLPMRGSRNQRIINLKTGENINDGI